MTILLLKHRCERLKDQRRQLCRFCCPFETQIVTGTVNFQQFRPGGNQLPSFFYLLNTPKRITGSMDEQAAGA